MRASFTPAVSPAASTSLGTVRRTGDLQVDTQPAEMILVGTSAWDVWATHSHLGASACLSRAAKEGCAWHPNWAHTHPPMVGAGMGSHLMLYPTEGLNGASKRLLGSSAWGGALVGSQGEGANPQQWQLPPIPTGPPMPTHSHRHAGWRSRVPGQQHWTRCSCRCPGVVGPHSAGPGCAAGLSWPPCSPVCLGQSTAPAQPPLAANAQLGLVYLGQEWTMDSQSPLRRGF